MRTVKLGSLAPGLNNRLEPTQLQTVLPDRSPATYLYSAENVDINDKGYLKRRAGQALTIAGLAHSIWADERDAYVVLNDELLHLRQGDGGLAMTIIRIGMPRLPVSYSRGGDGEVYWSNGSAIRRVSAGQDRPVATDPLPSSPSIALGTGGLPAGKYIVAFTVVGPDGESPSTPPVQIDVPENGALVLGAVPAGAQIYVSGPNGDVPTLQGAGDGGPFTLYTLSAGGRRCATLNAAVMPAGTIVRHYNGAMLVASGNALYISLPYNYGLLDPVRGYITFPTAITLVEPLDSGLFLATEDLTYWITDVLTGADGLHETLPYGAVPGSSEQLPAQKQGQRQVCWNSPRGLVIGSNDGSARALQDDVLTFSDAASGATLFRERDGMRQVITSRFGAEPSVAAASSFMDAEVIRKGTTL